MFANIKKSIAEGKVSAPPSKSMSHRLLICAGLCDGVSVIDNVEFSEDILATIDCLTALGVKFDINNNTVTVKGINPTKTKGNITLNCRESGSTLRFFIPILLLSGCNATFCGSSYLLHRPLDAYKEICKKQNLDFCLTESELRVSGGLLPDKFTVAGNISSQFISGLLFALPHLNSDSIINITPPVESRSYIDLTISALKTFGIDIVWIDDKTLYIKGNQTYKCQNVAVEGDYSNAAFYEAFNRVGGNIRISGLNSESLQGDKVYNYCFDLLENGNATIDITDCPDLAPILITVAAIKNGAIFTGTKRLAIKESNRGVVLAEELAKFGADIQVYEDKIIVNKSELYMPCEILNGHNDHRIVMSLAVISSVFSGKIEGIEAVSKSFPDFFEKIKLLGVLVDINDN